MSARAGARLLKRISGGFGVADNAKFASFSAEVINACEQYSEAEVDRAADAIVRLKTRPHIGDVYAALDAAKASTRQPEAIAGRSDWRDLALVTAWICGNTVRWHDWQPEFGNPGENEAGPFIPEEKLRGFALEAASRLRRDVADLVWKAEQPEIRLKKLRPMESEAVRRLRYGLASVDRAKVRQRLASAQTPSEGR